MESSGKLRFQIDSARETWNIKSKDKVDNNVWYHAVVTFPDMSLYLNGTLQAEKKTATRGMEVTGVYMEFARSNGDENYYYAGYLDEVAIFDVQFNQAQVEEIYNKGKPNDLTTTSVAGNLKSWWRMGEGDNIGSNLYDNKSDYDGVFINMEAVDITTTVP